MSVKTKSYKSGLYSIKSKQKVNEPIEEIWDFFCNPKNLNLLTPTDMKFKILSGRSEDFYIGKIISYNVNPFKFFNMKWVTEISFIEKYQKYFAGHILQWMCSIKFTGFQKNNYLKCQDQ